jgi:hypothetical protein
MLPWCGDPSNAYGSLLTFKTLRTGFPTAPVTVVDNASHPAVRSQIADAARAAGARFVQLERAIQHHEFIADVLMRQPDGAAVFLDPDLVFWANVEDWDFGGALVAGRLLPTFRCEYTRTITHARLHTSFLWIPDVQRLRDEAGRVMRGGRFEWHPLRPSMFVLDGEWHRLDTGASLYQTFADRCRPFTVTELDAYDHLFVGSHLNLVTPTLPTEDAAHMAEMHSRVSRGDLDALRGAWRWQEDFFARRKV